MNSLQIPQQEIPGHRQKEMIIESSDSQTASKVCVHMPLSIVFVWDIYTTTCEANSLWS